MYQFCEEDFDLPGQRIGDHAFEAFAVLGGSTCDPLVRVHGDKLPIVSAKERDMPNIPREHYTGLIVGFGYPEISYARGWEREGLSIIRIQNRNDDQRIALKIIAIADKN